MRKPETIDSVIAGRRVLVEGKFRPGWAGFQKGVWAVSAAGAPPSGVSMVDVGMDPLGPAFVDTHVHGFGGFDASGCGNAREGEAVLRGMARALLTSGVGAFCPTLYPLTEAETLACLRTIGRVRAESRDDEAVVVGAHLEGPFVNPSRAGALDRKRLLDPDVNLMTRYLDTGAVSIVTLAPELTGADRIARVCAESGCVVSMGHSLATFSQAQRACARGVGSVTHLFNAMAPLHHRDATIANFAVMEQGLPTEVIPDLTHMGAHAMDLLFRARGLDGLRFVSDNLVAAGTGVRGFRAGGARLTVKSGIAYNRGGAIAGSCLPLASSVRALWRTGLLGLEDCWRLAAENPARLVKPVLIRGAARLRAPR